MFLLPFVPTRLAPVPLEDSGGLLDRDGRAPLRMHLPPHTTEGGGSTEAQKRQSLPLVFWHQLFPLLPPLHLGELDLSGTTKPRVAWQNAVYTAGYQPSRITLDDYHTMVGSKGLFGVRVNPLQPVIDVAHSVNDPSLLRHYIFAVALQYYLIARRAWLETRTDADAPYSERLPPHVFVTLKAEDWCYSGSTLDQAGECLDDQQSQLADLAQRLPFPRFLCHVLTWVQRLHPNAFPGDAQREDARFCDEKLRKNFVQALTCMRFREWRPVNFCERTGAREHAIKFFPRPGSARMRATENDDPRFAQLFTHVFFAPDEPVVTLDDSPADESRIHLLWRLLCFFPLNQFETRVNVHAKRELTSTTTASSDSDPESEGGESLHHLFPKTARDKWVLYEGFMRLNPVRARYTFFFEMSSKKDERAYVYVPNLHLPETLVGDGILPVDESDVRHITQHTFEWLVARGQRLLPEAEAKVKTEEDVKPASWITVEDDPIQTVENWFAAHAGNNAWLQLWSYLRRFRSEEVAYALMYHRHKRTLAEIQASRTAFVHYLEDVLDREWRADAQHPQIERLQQLQNEVNGWNRCHILTPYTTSERSLLLVWHILFPHAHIGFGSDASASDWYSHWTTAPVLTLVRTRLAEFRAKMQASAVLRELRSCPRERITDDMRQDMQQVARLMPPDSECQNVLMDLSA